MDRWEALGMRRLASLALGSTSTASDDAQSLIPSVAFSPAFLVALHWCAMECSARSGGLIPSRTAISLEFRCSSPRISAMDSGSIQLGSIQLQRASLTDPFTPEGSRR